MKAVFPKPDNPPTDEAFAATIGKDHRTITGAMDQLRKDHKTIAHTYKFSKTSGWYLCYDKGRQRLCYLFPKRSDFLLKIVFNDKGVANLRSAEVGIAVKEKIATAKKYSEGTLLEFTAAEITTEVLGELLRIKIASV